MQGMPALADREASPYDRAVRQSILALLLVVAACGDRGGVWPTLARRPIEGPLPAAVALPRCAAASCGDAYGSAAAAPAVVPSDVAALGADPSVAVEIADIPARLTVIDRDLRDASERLTAQNTATAAAVAAARGAKADSSAASQAEIERTALDRIGNQVGEIRARLDAIAGTLAAASVGGTDVAAPLATTGRLIVRAIALQKASDTAAAGRR